MDADLHFYGPPEERQRLEDRVNEFDASAWLSRHGSWGFGRPFKQQQLLHEAAKLHNPYAGVPYAWQLTESLDDFFARLPPATTDGSNDLPWIFICNPYVARDTKHTGDGDFMRGNEDEAPAQGGQQLRLVVQGSMERLELLAELQQRVVTSGNSQAFITRERIGEQKKASADILNLAHAGRVRTGKWMIFCPPADVNEVWELVARATAKNELGVAAKVAPRPEFDDARKDRLVCVYTADFRDKTDVGRVLQRLRELRLADPVSRPIYYKPDVYTYIGLASGNPWGLAASVYSSKEFPRDG